jgi:hypothetical protein
VNAPGTALVYSSYLGGSAGDSGPGSAGDGAGNAYGTGQTGSTNFPTTAGAFQTTPGGSADTLVTKLNASDSGLAYSTFLGGAGGGGIAVDTAGTAYVTGETLSSSFPTTAGAFRTTLAGPYNAFVTVLNASVSALVYSSYLGGSGGPK